MRILATSALLVLAGTLASCGGGPVNQRLSSINQPVVSRTDYVFDVHAGGQGLSYTEEARLADWFETLQLGYGDRISLDDPDPYGSGERRAKVAEIAARYGLLLADRAPVTAGQLRPGEMRVVVSRTSAEVPNCPNWDRHSNGDFAGSTPSNYGCAVNSNVAAMVADPAHLVRGERGDGSGDPRTTNRAIGAYREAEPTGADNTVEDTTTTDGGN